MVIVVERQKTAYASAVLIVAGSVATSVLLVVLIVIVIRLNHTRRFTACEYVRRIQTVIPVQ